MNDNSTPESMPTQPRLGTVDNFAAFYGVTTRTVRNWIAAGHFPVYRMKGHRGVLIDLDEASEAINRIRTPQQAGPARRKGYGSRADVRTLRPRAVVVPSGEEARSE